MLSFLRDDNLDRTILMSGEMMLDIDILNETTDIYNLGYHIQPCHLKLIVTFSFLAVAIYIYVNAIGIVTNQRAG